MHIINYFNFSHVARVFSIEIVSPIHDWGDLIGFGVFRFPPSICLLYRLIARFHSLACCFQYYLRIIFRLRPPKRHFNHAVAFRSVRRCRSCWWLQYWQFIYRLRWCLAGPQQLIEISAYLWWPQGSVYPPSLYSRWNLYPGEKLETRTSADRVWWSGWASKVERLKAWVLTLLNCYKAN